MKQNKFKPWIFLGIDFTPRKRYRGEITKLERLYAELKQSFAASHNERNDFLSECAKERELRYTAEAKLKKYDRKHGANGKFVKNQ